MSRPSTPSSILVDVALPDAAPVAGDLIEILSSLRVVLLGWYKVPEQTSPDQAREQFEEEFLGALDKIAEPFRRAGAEVEVRLVFTGDELETVSRISTEEQVDAILIDGPMKDVRQVLVPLRGVQNAGRIATFVADLVNNPETEVVLLHVLDEEEDEATIREEVLEPVTKQMIDRGLDADAIRHETTASDDPGQTIIERSAESDIVVLGETEPSVREVLFGSVPEQIAHYAHVPVLVVRHEEEDVDMAEEAGTRGR